jgi:hypothetical protein
MVVNGLLLDSFAFYDNKGPTKIFPSFLIELVTRNWLVFWIQRYISNGSSSIESNNKDFLESMNHNIIKIKWEEIESMHYTIVVVVLIFFMKLFLVF